MTSASDAHFFSSNAPVVLIVIVGYCSYRRNDFTTTPALSHTKTIPSHRIFFVFFSLKILLPTNTLCYFRYEHGWALNVIKCETNQMVQKEWLIVDFRCAFSNNTESATTKKTLSFRRINNEWVHHHRSSKHAQHNQYLSYAFPFRFRVHFPKHTQYSTQWVCGRASTMAYPWFLIPINIYQHKGWLFRIGNGRSRARDGWKSTNDSLVN